MKKIPSSGPAQAKIMLVGEAPGSTEEMQGAPFVGASGTELTKMLTEAGINRDECYITNVCKYRPPSNKLATWFLNKTTARKEHVNEICGRYPNSYILEGLTELFEEIEAVAPSLIIAFGDTALWALSGEAGITKWRGSILKFGDIPVVPTYHPAAILRVWAWRFIAVQDLRRAATVLADRPQPPGYSFILRPSFPTVMEVLNDTYADVQKQPTRLACDIETRSRHIACFGFAWSNTDAICIPHMDVHNPHGYWSVEEEATIIWRLRELLLHPNVEVIGQNWLYDMQYIARHWGFIPWPHLDTMIAHHVLFAGLPKGLDFLSSLYNDYHVYWKDEGKQWDPRYVDEEQLWEYNCKDCTNTYEASYHIEKAAVQLGLTEQVSFQMQMVRPILKTMLRGMNTSRETRTNISLVLVEAMLDRQSFLNFVLDREFNPRSPPQMKKLFYTQLGVPPVLHKKTKKPTLAKDALFDLRKKADPILHPIIDAIVEFRRAGTFNSVATTRIDADNRIRCSYNIAGTETYRLSSSEDAFGFGTNLQNVSKGD
jgi:uracil-DNA glycosylase family 4